MSNEMNNIIIYCVGIVTFLIMEIFKIPIKRCTWGIAEEKAYGDEEEALILYHRLNIIIIIFAMLFALVLYSMVVLWMGETHFKLCCSLKGGAIAMALNAITEQIIGKRSHDD